LRIIGKIKIMRNRVKITLYFLFISGLLFIPQIGTSQFSLKIGAGFQGSGIAFDSPDFSTSWRTGSHYNLNLVYGSRFYVESGLMLVSSSQTIVPKATLENPQPERLDAKLTAIHIPLILGFNVFDEDANFNFRGFGGTEMRMVAADRKDSDYDAGQFRFANFGYIFGVGASFQFLYAELAYRGGLTNIFKEDIADFKNRQHLITFTLGVHLFR
jgi:hypothetical protein